jgi:hypothetical protein
MNHEYSEIIDKLLDMHPDPIPNFVLLKEFKGYAPDSIEYQNSYDRVCEHPFVKEIEINQNSKGFWPSFHSYSEGLIRKLLWYGLDNSHICLKKVIDYTVKLLHNEEPYDRFEKQDNVRWWPEIFMPLVCAATLSLLDNANENLDFHRKRWADFAEISLKKGYYNYETDSSAQNIHFNFFSKPVSEKRSYDYEADKKAQNAFFGFPTKSIIPPHNYYNFLLLPPHNGISFLSDSTDQALVDYCMNEADCIYYVYNKNPGVLVSINGQSRDSKDFGRWIRALFLISQFKGWAKYEQKYVEWILTQRNQDGLWEFPKKSDPFALSDSWKGKNRAIDSTIYVLRMLLKKKAF